MNIKHLLKIVGIGAALLILLIGLSVIIPYDEELGCLDDGGIWDGHNKQCRHDCAAWNEKEGCIPMTEENLMKYGIRPRRQIIEHLRPKFEEYLEKEQALKM